MIIRALATGFMIGWLMPNSIPRFFFIALPWALILILALVKSPLVSFVSGLGLHPVVLIVSFLGTCWLLLRLLAMLPASAWIVLRLCLMGLYGLFYGAIAYDLANNDLLWGLLFGSLAAWWMARITRPAPAVADHPLRKPAAE